ncbi:MAG TPA: ATP-binding cassette domain-containing protein, partial [Phenylobacterium sp.]|nr:ATP-binding cassette domain-containing protein [Phenylobacterium sp.]
RFTGLDLDVDVQAPPGVTVLFGPSGSGKTTLVNAVAGLLRPAAGTIAAGDWVLMDTAARHWLPPHRRRLGYIFQEGRLFPHLTVRQNLALAQTLAHGRTEPGLISELIERVGLTHRADALPRAMSHGEGQRAAIARALCTRPALLVADEPTSALDDANAQVICDLLVESASANGATLLIATHDTRLRDRFERVLALQPPGAAA